MRARPAPGARGASGAPSPCIKDVTVPGVTHLGRSARCWVGMLGWESTRSNERRGLQATPQRGDLERLAGPTKSQGASDTAHRARLTGDTAAGIAVGAGRDVLHSGRHEAAVTQPGSPVAPVVRQDPRASPARAVGLACAPSYFLGRPAGRVTAERRPRRRDHGHEATTPPWARRVAPPATLPTQPAPSAAPSSEPEGHPAGQALAGRPTPHRHPSTPPYHALQKEEQGR